MKPEELKVGVSVRFKSGGPRMTISKVHPKTTDGVQYVDCDWFAGNDRKSDTFDIDLLSKDSGSSVTFSTI